MRVLTLSAFAAALLSTSTTLAEAICSPPVPPNCPFNPREIRTYRVHGCTASVQANWDGPNGRTERNSCIGTAPAGTMLVDVTPHSVGLNNGNYTVSKFSSGLDFRYEREVLDTYDEAIDLAVKAGNKNLEAKLKTERSEFQRYVESIRSNIDGVRVEVSASTHGTFFDRKGGHAFASADMHVACVRPGNLREQLASRHQFLWPRTTSASRVMFINSGTKTAYLAINAGPAQEDCSSGQRRTGNYTIAPKDSAEVSLADDDNACFLWGEEIPRRSQPQTFCKATGGEKVELHSRQECRIF